MQLKHGLMQLFGFLCLFLISSQQALSLSPVNLKLLDAPYSITDQLTYIKDIEGNITAERIFDDTSLKWQAHGNETPNFGITKSVYWWRFKLKNDANYNDWLLVIGYPLLDSIDLYIDKESSGLKPQHDTFGDKYSFNHRPVSHRLFLKELDIKKGESITIYMRIASKSPIQGPIEIWPKTAFFISDQDPLIQQGFYYGGMIIMALFNLIIFAVIRDKSYFYYVFFVFFQAAFQAAIHGFGYQYIWPHSTGFQQISTVLALNISMAFAALFFDNLLKLKHRSPYSSILIRLTAVFLFAQAALIFIVPYIWALRISMLTVCLLSIAAVFIALPMCFKNIVEAKFFVIGWGFMILGGLVLALDKAGLVPQSIITANSFQIGTIIEIILLSLAMANRINTEKQQRYIAQRQALEVQKDANENLEKKVLERTQELEALNAKLDEMSRTDALTGVLNRRAFDEIYQHETEYCGQHKIPLSILMLDIDHFKNINDTYGHECGDECLRIVGQLLKSSLSGEHVHFTRYGGEEFVISMRGVDKEEAMKQAEHLRTTMQDTSFQASNGQVIKATISIGVASGIPKLLSETGLLYNADKALYDAKNNGRNLVQASQI